MIRRLFRLAGREPSVADDVQAEFDSHLAHKADALIRSGWTPEAARAEAMRALGPRPALEQATRRAADSGRRRRARLERLADAATATRQAVRSLARTPAFTVTAIGVLALGIGGSLAVAALADRLLLRPLPLAAPDLVAVLFERNPAGGLRIPSLPTIEDWRAEPGGFERIGYVPGDRVAWHHGARVESVLAAYPSPEFFGLLGAQPVLGRTLGPSDDAESQRVAVVSHDFWRRQLGGGPDAVGTALNLADGPVTVVGVMGPGVRLPAWADLYLPLSLARPPLRAAIALRGNHADGLVFGRLAPRSTFESALARLATVGLRLGREYPEEQQGWTATAVPLRDFVLDPGQVTGQGLPNPPRTVLLFGAAVGFVLLIACANVACLTLVRSRARERELAIRASIGADRATLMRRLLIESALIAGTSALAGLAIAGGLIELVQRVAPGLFPRLAEVSLDPRLVAVAIGLGLVTTVASGLLPAVRVTQGPLVARIVGDGTKSTAAPGQLRGQRGLVILQLALAVTLVIGATVLGRSFARVLAVPIGFEPDGLIAISINPDHDRYRTPAATVELYRTLQERVAGVAGVVGVAITNHVPLSGSSMPTRVVADGRAVDDSSALPTASFRTISPNYFSVLGIPILKGRGYGDGDLANPSDGLVINATLARQLWPEQDPIGRRLTVFRSARWLADFGTPIGGVVIGVVGDVRHFGAEGGTPAEVYVPYPWNPWQWTGLVARTRGDAERLIDPIWAAVAAVDADLPAATGSRKSVTTFATIAREGQSPRRLVTGAAVTIATVALVLAMVGLYGLVAYQVGLRRREFAIRSALGAQRRGIVLMVLRSGLAPVFAGIGLGMVVAWSSVSLLASLVFGVSPRDTVTFIAVPVALVAVAAAAVLVEARRATAVPLSQALG